MSLRYLYMSWTTTSLIKVGMAYGMAWTTFSFFFFFFFFAAVASAVVREIPPRDLRVAAIGKLKSN